jgi:hypothetical protein
MAAHDGYRRIGPGNVFGLLEMIYMSVVQRVILNNKTDSFQEASSFLQLLITAGPAMIGLSVRQAAARSGSSFEAIPESCGQHYKCFRRASVISAGPGTAITVF